MQCTIKSLEFGCLQYLENGSVPEKQVKQHAETIYVVSSFQTEPVFGKRVHIMTGL